MATGHPFPSLTPSSRVYTAASYPQSEFQGLNGAVTTLQYGLQRVDSKLEMTFTNITDKEAYEIWANYRDVNGGYDQKTGERDYVYISDSQVDTMDGVQSWALRQVMSDEGYANGALRYRYATPPVITSTFPGRSTVQVDLRGYLDGATSA